MPSTGSEEGKPEGRTLEMRGKGGGEHEGGDGRDALDSALSQPVQEVYSTRFCQVDRIPLVPLSAHEGTQQKSLPNATFGRPCFEEWSAFSQPSLTADDSFPD